MKFRIFNRLIKIDINTCQPEPHWKRQVINRVWDEYKTGRSKGDVVFLYKNENEGYSDMYQILGNAYLRIERRQKDNSCYYAGRTVDIFLTDESTKERLLSETEASQCNLYTAIGNHTGHITCLLMAPLLKRMQKTNPFGLLKMLLKCLQSENVMLLLDYFDSDDI